VVVVVVLVVEVVVAAVALVVGEAASVENNSVAEVVGTVAVVAVEVVKQDPVEIAVEVELHSLPVAVEELLHAVAETLVGLVGVAVGVAAGAADLHRTESGSRLGPFVETDGLSMSLCGVLSIAQEVEAFLSFPFFVAQRCCLVHPNWHCHKYQGPPFWEVQF